MSKYWSLEHPKQKIYINNKLIDISADDISTIVTLRENGIADCKLEANNDKGKMYLSTLALDDKIEVYYRYVDVIEGQWIFVFSGKVYELAPIFIRSGDICQVVVYGKGYPLKIMRVAEEYGVQGRVDILNPVSINGTYPINSYTLEAGFWIKYGVYPYLSDYDDVNYISSSVTGNIDSYYHNFNIPFQEKTIFKSIKLELVAKVTGLASGTIECFIWFNNTWYSLGEKSTTSNTYVVLTYDIYPEPYSMLTQQQVNDLRIRVKDINSTGQGISIQVTQARLVIEGSTGKKITLKNVLTDTTDGIIPKFVEKIFGGDLSKHGINTQYIYDYSDEYNYVYYPFESAFDCLQELIKIASAMEAIKGSVWKGLHWIVTPNDELIITKVNDHSVGGTRNDIETKWPTRPLSNPLVVREDMIVEMFKTEAHPANYILVAGKYCLPLTDIWCEPLGFKDWSKTDYEGPGGIDGFSFTIDYYTSVVGDASLKCRHWCTGGGDNYRHIYRPLVLDFTKLVGLQSKVHVCLQIKGSGGDVRVSLYSSTAIPNKHTGDFFLHDITAQLDDSKWTIIEIPITKTDIEDVTKNAVWTKYGNPSWSSIKQLVIEFHHGAQLTAWDYTIRVDDIHIVGNTLRAAYDSTLISNPYHKGWINPTTRDPNATGIFKYIPYDGFGCRMITIKNSLAQTDTLDPNDDSASLAQFVLYELLRNKVDITTGSIQIPLTPQLTAGQIVHLHSQETFNTDGTHKGYTIDKDFRIVECEHRFTRDGGLTILGLVDDLQNSIPLRPTDPYTITMRAISPDFQTKTLASLRTGGDFDVGLLVIAKDYPS